MLVLLDAGLVVVEALEMQNDYVQQRAACSSAQSCPGGCAFLLPQAAVAVK